MPDRIQPGAYVEETASYSRRIEPAPTAVTALLGTCRRGPADEPVPVESLAAFDQAYGEGRRSSLRRAVRDYFANGGGRALTVRVEDGSAALANLSGRRWQLLVVDPSVVRLADAHAMCLRHRAFLICDAAGAGGLPEGLGTNAAAYYPRLAGRSGSRPCAPSVAGVFARTDSTRGVWIAPAGTEATLQAELSQQVDADDIDELGQRRVNALRALPGVGTVIWSARTASGDAEWKYVPVRRTILFIERSIEQGLGWVVFEPNDEPLWAGVRSGVEDFLFELWRQGGLVGASAEECYFVRCDRSTMTQADIDAGRLVVLVGVAMLKPAEFGTFRIQARTGAAS